MYMVQFKLSNRYYSRLWNAAHSAGCSIPDYIRSLLAIAFDKEES